MGNKNILRYARICLFILVTVCLFVFVIACLLMTCFRDKNEEMPILTTTLKTNTFELSDSTYYIEKIEILDFSHDKLYEMHLDNGDGVSIVNLSFLPKGYISEGSFELSDTNEYGINVYVVSTKDQKSYKFHFVITRKDSLPFQKRPLILRP